MDICECLVGHLHILFLVRRVAVRVRCVKCVAFRNFASDFVLFFRRRLFLSLTDNEKTESLPSKIAIQFGSNPGREQIGSHIKSNCLVRRQKTKVS
jgi:hypothetical protein